MTIGYAVHSRAIYKRLCIVFVLGFSSGLPLALITTTLQAWFSSMGASVLATGLLSVLSFPYLLRMVWGPFVDRYTLLACGKRRGWIFLMQGVLCLGFNLLSWCVSLTTFNLAACLVFFLACCSSIQDVAIDAHRVEYLLADEQGLGASFAMTGYRLALIVASGIGLIFAAHFGWEWVYRFMGGILGLCMIATYCSPEPSILQNSTIKSICQSSINAVFLQKGSWCLIGFVFFYKLGEAFTTSTSGIIMPFLIQGMGFSLDTIAWVTNTLGIGALLFGGVLGGLILRKISLYNALWIFGGLQAVTNGLFVALSMSFSQNWLFALAVCSDNLVAGMGSTALVVLLMRSVDKKYTATHYSIFIALASLPRVLSGPLGAWLYNHFGWTGLYQLSVLLALGFMPFLWSLSTNVNGKAIHD